MSDKDVQQSKKHTVSVLSRGQVSVTGVTQVDSFDEHCVILKTDCGEMTVEGEGLRVGTLDITVGELEITGRICAICYGDAVPPKRGLRARLFG